MDFIHSAFYFILVIGILVAFHEFGHFWVARRSGVKVLRFSVGFGKIVWRYQKSPEDTEYVLSAIPLGGYVKMLDEREGPVRDEELRFAFNRQPLYKRTAIVAAGPIFNLLLAVVLFWLVLVTGEIGMRPIIGPVPEGSLAAQAEFVAGDEIQSVNDRLTPTWSEAMSALFAAAMAGQQQVEVAVKSGDDVTSIKTLVFPEGVDLEPNKLYERIGLVPWMPVIKPVLGEVLPDGAAAAAGQQPGDLIISADNVEITEWMQWVDYVRSHAGVTIELVIERDGVRMPLVITPAAVQTDEGPVGRIGAKVQVPEDLLAYLQVSYSLPPVAALIAACERTWFFSITTVKLMGYMLIGQAPIENLSGPISIAQYAGQSASVGLTQFLKFLAVVSVSLGVLNLLPIPVLDGGHLLFYALEAIKGSPVSEKAQMFFQNIGVALLITLMVVATFLDIERLFQ